MSFTARRLRTGPSPWTHYTPIITWTVIVAYTAMAAGMVLQASRFARTPSYAILLNLASAPAWGTAYAAVALSLLAWRSAVHWRYRHHRKIGVAAHTMGIALTLWWLGAFVIRYATDSGTTIVNVVSWSVMSSLMIRSSVGLDEDAERRPDEAPR